MSKEAIKTLEDIRRICHNDGVIIPIDEWNKLREAYGSSPLFKEIQNKAGYVTFSQSEVRDGKSSNN